MEEALNIASSLADENLKSEALTWVIPRLPKFNPKLIKKALAAIESIHDEWWEEKSRLGSSYLLNFQEQMEVQICYWKG